MHIPSYKTTINDEFLIDFKHQTETFWQNTVINPAVYGFQFQKGTRWNQGLTINEIVSYELALDTQFPYDYKHMLGFMNGTDLPTLNIYGSNGQPQQEYVGVYSYPRDLPIIQSRIREIDKDRSEIALELQEQGFNLEPTEHLVPIFSHRYIVCGLDLNKSAVISIMGTDVVIYGDSLRAYLQKEFLHS
jgi:hypothetical protein